MINTSALTNATPTARLVWAWLTTSMDSNNQVVESLTEIGRCLGISQRSVNRAIKQLRALGLVERKEAGTKHQDGQLFTIINNNTDNNQ